MSLVKKSLYFSVFVQFFALIISVYAQLMPTTPDKALLHDTIVLDNIVQFIEMMFYVIVGLTVANFSQTDIAKYRYYDWTITTPIMLFTTMLYFVYRDTQREEYKNKSKLRLLDVLKGEKTNTLKLVLSNLGMLIVGYLQEIDYVGLFTSSVLGFGFLFYSFYILYQYTNQFDTQVLFWIMFTLWSIYGIAAMFKNETKNTMYNILDIFAKNFYGVFIAYKLLV